MSPRNRQKAGHDRSSLEINRTELVERIARTLEVDGASYEAVPETLIVKAGLAAAATLVSA